MIEMCDGTERPVTCAMVIVDRNGSILACHATGRPSEFGYDFPKGVREPGETDFDAAKRELDEETGILFKDLLSDHMCWDKAVDLGVHRHNRYKDIHLFVCPVRDFPDISGLKCRSCFERDGYEIPEMDGYRVIGRDERGMFNRVLQDRFADIDFFVNGFIWP